MKLANLVSTLAGFATIVILATETLAMYSPHMGRFMQRDPGPSIASPARIDTAGITRQAAKFPPRDRHTPSCTMRSCDRQPSKSCPFSMPTVAATSSESDGQYDDGMNLYQYVRGNPTVLRDPMGEKSIQDCPKSKRKPRPGYKPLANGCGPADSNFLLQGIIWKLQDYGDVDFTSACNQHDLCYGRCNSDKGKCDSDLKEAMIAECLRNYAATSAWKSFFTLFGPERQLAKCRAAAEAFYQAVSKGGDSAYWAAQEQACICCE